MNKYKNGYSIPIVIIILAFVCFSLSLTVIWVSYYLQQTSKRVKKYSDYEPFYEILEEILPEFGLGVKDTFT
ncbi:MAG: hypothetical protein KAT05_09505, partial [Spirochaetes bacterium]|nr:hypothetical protein [Spirochaetota bacterium]